MGSRERSQASASAAGDPQILEAHGIDGLHLQHLEGGRVTLAAGRGSEAVPHRLERAGGHQAVARGFEIRLAGELPHLEPGDRHHLLLRVVLEALDDDGVDGPPAAGLRGKSGSGHEPSWRSQFPAPAP